MRVAGIDRDTKTDAEADVYRIAGHEIAPRTIAAHNRERRDHGEAGRFSEAFTRRASSSLAHVRLDDERAGHREVPARPGTPMCRSGPYLAPSANSWLRLLMNSVLPTATGDE